MSPVRLWQSLRIIQLGPAEAQECVTSESCKDRRDMCVWIINKIPCWGVISGNAAALSKFSDTGHAIMIKTSIYLQIAAKLFCKNQVQMLLLKPLHCVS